MNKLLLPFIIGILVLVSCQKKDDNQTKPPGSINNDTTTLPFVADYNMYQLPYSTAFSSTGAKRGDVTLQEASGLANSINNPKYLWTHEDSGNQNYIYLLSKKSAALVATYRIVGATDVDWEDIATGPGPVDGVTYVYIGDIGDNSAKKTNRRIYRIPEPVYNPADSGQIIDVNLEATIKIAYPKGPRDAETLMIDPLTKDLFIVSKREAKVQLFQAAYPQPTDGTTDTLELMGTFPFTEAVGGDISADGQCILIKTYDTILYWKKEGNESIPLLLAKTPERAPYNPLDVQGEAICWDGKSYYTTSERVSVFIPALHFYQGK